MDLDSYYGNRRPVYDGGRYRNSASLTDDVSSGGGRSYFRDAQPAATSWRRAKPPPPPPPPLETTDSGGKKKKSKSKRTPSTTSTDTVTSSTSSGSASDSSSGTYTYTGDTSTTTSGYSFSSASETDSSSSSSSGDSGRHHKQRRRSKSNSKPRRRSSSGQSLSTEVADACSVLLEKEKQLKRLEMELLAQKQNFAREVRRRASLQKSLSEDEALVEMQRLVALDDPTPSLQEYIRQNRPSPVLMANGNSNSDSNHVDAITNGTNRVSAYQPPFLSLSPSIGNAATPTAGIAGDKAALPPLPPSVSPSDAPNAARSTPPPPAVAAYNPTRDREEVSVDGSHHRRMPSEGGSTLEVEVRPLDVLKPPTAPAVQPDTAQNNNSASDKGPQVVVALTPKAAEWSGSREGDGAAGMGAASLSVGAADKSMSESARTPRAQSMRSSPGVELSSEGILRTSNNNENNIHSVSHALTLHQKPSGDYAPATSDKRRPSATTAPKRKEIISPQKDVPQPTATQQPWAALPQNWPCQSAAVPQGSLERTNPAQQTLWYRVNTSGPMSSNEFKALLCAEYIAPSTPPRTQTNADYDSDVDGGEQHVLPASHEPFLEPQVEHTRPAVEPTAVDNEPAAADDPVESHPPPPPPLLPYLVASDAESVVEFPPPPVHTAPDMPPPKVGADECCDDCGCDCCDCDCGCGCPWCECCPSSCCGCWRSLLRWCFPCCYSNQEGHS